jgi:hypothetical protein
MKEHNNLWCERSSDTVIPDRQGKCSHCGAILHELTVAEASRLVDVLEELALDRTKQEHWQAEDWLFDDEAMALAIAKKTVFSERR